MSLQTFFKFAFAIAASLMLAGCALSINPIVRESDSVYDTRLIGTWEEADGSDRATIARAEGNSYAIEYTSDGNTGSFVGRLGRLGGSTLLDVSPAKQKKEPPNPAFDMMVGAHLFLALDIGQDEVAVAALDPDSLLAALKSGAVGLPYHNSKEEFILNGTTEELREALGPWLAHPGAMQKREKWGHARRTTEKMTGPVEVPCFEAAAWREADNLFRGDPYWLGSDAASSVDLGGGRVLWLFGDTWINPSGNGTRIGARMVSNTVAIQTGTDPSKASMKFYWGRSKDGAPAAMIPDDGKVHHWFGNGIRVGDRLVLFLGSIFSTNNGLGFASAGWVAWIVENPDAEPSAWKMHPLTTPANVLGVCPGFTAIRRVGGYVYAFGSEDPVKSHPLYAVRWPAEDVQAGRLMAPEWWAGKLNGWVGDSSHTPRFPLFENGAPEMSIHFDEASGRFLAVQVSGYPVADLMMRAAPDVTGPWTSARMIYRPAEYYKPNAAIYAAKAHPELTGADLILTYATNGSDIGVVANDNLLYYPRFVRLTRCR